MRKWGTGRPSASNTRRAKCRTHLDLAAEEADPADLLQGFLDTGSFLGHVPLRQRCGHGQS